MNSSIGILTGKREHKASPETYYSIQRAFPQHQTQTVELPLSSKSRQPNLDLVDFPILSIHP
jgi:hypothetical protein